jgi:hypothetical protein
MLCPKHCGIVAPVPAPHARTADISRLASWRRSYVCAAVTNHTNCNAVKQRAKIVSATIRPWCFLGDKVLPKENITSDLQSDLCPGSQNGRLQTSYQEAQAPRASPDFQSNLSTGLPRPTWLPEAAKNDLNGNAGNAFVCIPAAPAPRFPHRRECRSKIVGRFSGT